MECLKRQQAYFAIFASACPPVLQFASPPVRQSASPRVRQSGSAFYPHPVMICLLYFQKLFTNRNLQVIKMFLKFIFEIVMIRFSVVFFMRSKCRFGAIQLVRIGVELCKNLTWLGTIQLARLRAIYKVGSP